MAKDSNGANPGDVFDVRKVRRLVELMNEHELSEIDLRQSDQRIRLRKGGDPIVTAVPAAPVPAAPAPAAGAPAADAPAAAAPEAVTGKVITSPIVGTFYASPSPDAAPFVKVGDQIGPETVVCIVEAMKVFNEVPAEISGKIAAVLVESGDAVEFGQPLFKVE
ncbi:acetyl-CoA carboxylase biotin carboxyl carrier protein [Aeoliella sp. ICT_H6.2]|uniref:Biotin carboxyl carrier protein of acetyl-CoA carboxylase n=1 Tax=Aeoliella straminimaris TaxID=2954799 RepID=A0A9X2JI49_9BACT|nr:acetyl-CoA carboxylase biotin carboxyl carrier protein [Aeoliella straminimaris]MCO6043589.1 acetyl-CoA carboxylase biotin carboxyl carrier protein [Aeoliella straminimaris]